MFISDAKTLYGLSGGQLEFVSQRVEYKKDANGDYAPYIIMRFTDHDVQILGNNTLVEDKFYELEFPLFVKV